MFASQNQLQKVKDDLADTRYDVQQIKGINHGLDQRIAEIEKRIGPKPGEKSYTSIITDLWMGIQWEKGEFANRETVEQLSEDFRNLLTHLGLQVVPKGTKPRGLAKVTKGRGKKH